MFGQSNPSTFKGLLRELNPGPLAPEARIMPLDQAANDKFAFLALLKAATPCFIVLLLSADCACLSFYCSLLIHALSRPKAPSYFQKVALSRNSQVRDGHKGQKRNHVKEHATCIKTLRFLTKQIKRLKGESTQRYKQNSIHLARIELATFSV